MSVVVVVVVVVVVAVVYFAAKIGLFYLIFYSSLAAFFAIMLAGFFSTIDRRRPTQTGMTSLIKMNPGQSTQRSTIRYDVCLEIFNCLQAEQTIAIEQI